MADELTEKIVWRRKCIKRGVLFLLGFLAGGVLPYLGIRFFDNLFGAKYPILGPIAEFLELPAMLTTGALFGLTLAGCLKFPWFQYCLNRICPDPPSFVASDLARARQATFVLLENPPAVFVGPYTEPQKLADLLAGNQDHFSWQSLIGPSGIGKTRLALEWLQHWRDIGKWDVGIVDYRDREKITGWRPRRNTALVIDNVDEHWQASLGLTLSRLGKNAGSKKEVRVLVVSQIEPFLSHKDFETTNGTSYERVKKAKIRDNNPLRLSGLDVSHLAQLMDLARYDKISAQELLEETQGRPLAAFIMFHYNTPTYAEALRQWTNYVCEKMDKEENKVIVLTALVGSFSSGQAAGVVSLDPDKLARYFGAINFKNTDVVLPELPKILAQEILLRAFRSLNTDLEPLLEKALAINPDVVQARIAGICRARPDLFKTGQKDDISVDWLQKIQARLDALAPDKIQALREETADLAEETAAAELDLSRLGQIMARLADLADSRPLDPDIRLNEAGSARNAMYLYGSAQEWDALEKWGDRLVSLAENPHWADNVAIQYEAALGAYNAMLHYGEWQQWPQLEQWGKRLINLVEDERFADDPDMRFWEAQAASDAIDAYGSAQLWEQLEQWGQRLVDLAENPRWADNGGIRYWEASGAYNAMLHYGEWQQWPQLEKWGARLIVLVEDERFADDSDIRLGEAKAANNAMISYRKANKFDQMEEWGQRLIALASNPRWADHVDIRYWESRGAVEALLAYGDFLVEKSGKAIKYGIKLNEEVSFGGTFSISARSHEDSSWRNQALAYRPRVEQWLQQLEALAKCDRLADELDIRVKVATGLCGAVKYYARVQLGEEMSRWQQRLETVIADARFKNNVVIRLIELNSLFSLIAYFYGPQKNRQVLEELGARLVRLAEEAPFQDDPNIRMVEAMGLLKLMILYGNMSLLPDMERWGAHLVALAAEPQFVNNPKIRYVEALGADKALSLYPRVYLSIDGAALSRRYYWLKRLAACASAFPRNAEIQELASKHEVSFSQQIQCKRQTAQIMD